MEGQTIRIGELNVDGKSLFDRWYRKLDRSKQFEVDARMERVRLGNLGLHRNLRYGIVELKFESGLRIYGGWEGKMLLLLILGGDKKGQQADINFAEEIWLSYTKSTGSRK